MRREHPSALGAWERVQRALIDMFHTQTVDRMRASIAELREAVALDPDYAYAHSALAWLLYSAIINGATAEAHQHFDRAEQLAPSGGLSLYYRWYRSTILGFEARCDEAVVLLEAVDPQGGSLSLAADHARSLPRRAGKTRRGLTERTVRENLDLNLEGLALFAGAHPDPEQGRARVARLREYWPRVTT